VTGGRTGEGKGDRTGHGTGHGTGDVCGGGGGVTDRQGVGGVCRASRKPTRESIASFREPSIFNTTAQKGNGTQRRDSQAKTRGAKSS
jgi:hypothetical protein